MYQLYDPKKDPLVQRVRKRSRQLNPILICLIVGLIGWVIYREFLQQRLGNSAATTNLTALHLTGETTSAGSDAPILVHAENRKLYTVGESATFGISAEVKGKGSPALEGTTGLRLCFETDYTLGVTNVLEDGSVTMEARFGDANVYGNRFGHAVNIQRRDGVTQPIAAPANPVDTALNKDYDGPILSEFDNPVALNIAPDGSPKGESEAGKVGQLLGALVRLSGTAFPQSELRPGMTWERDVVFTLPGMKLPVAARVTSTLVGRANYYGVPCVQIENKIEPADAASAGLIPAIRAARALAHVEVTGRGTTYYDPVSRTMAWAQSEIDVDLIFAESVESALELFGTHSGILAELEGGPKSAMENYLKTAGDAPIGLHIQTSIARKK